MFCYIVDCRTPSAIGAIIKFLSSVQFLVSRHNINGTTVRTAKLVQPYTPTAHIGIKLILRQRLSMIVLAEFVVKFPQKV